MPAKKTKLCPICKKKQISPDFIHCYQCNEEIKKENASRNLNPDRKPRKGGTWHDDYENY